MIVRIDDESNENTQAIPPDYQRDPPAIATECFRSSPASQPYFAGGSGQGDGSVETDDVGGNRRVRPAGAGPPGGTNERQCRTDRRVVRIEPGRRPCARH